MNNILTLGSESSIDCYTRGFIKPDLTRIEGIISIAGAGDFESNAGVTPGWLSVTRTSALGNGTLPVLVTL